jgi:hypothetical protein
LFFSDFRYFLDWRVPGKGGRGEAGGFYTKWRSPLERRQGATALVNFTRHWFALVFNVFYLFGMGAMWGWEIVIFLDKGLGVAVANTQI